MSQHSSFRAAWGGLAALLSLGSAFPVQAGDWRPTHSVQYVVQSGAGAALDTAAREITHIIEKHKWIDQSIVVMNRTGGAGTLGIRAMMEHPGDAHYLTSFSASLLNTRAVGQVPVNYTELTPIVLLLQEIMVVAVRADSPIRDARDLVARLRAAPNSLSIGFATALGNNVHVGIAKPLKAAGVDITKLQMVPYKASTESITALLGGYVDVVGASTPNVTALAQAGKIRLLAVTSAQRLSGPLASVPTWKEQGVDAVYISVQGVMGPKDLTPAQIAYWEKAFRAATETDEWKQFVVKQNWRGAFLNHAEMTQYLATEYRSVKAMIDEMGLAEHR